MDDAKPKISAVVVTFNRLTLLKEVIVALRNQTRPLDEIIVVNNGSTDDTAAWLSEQPSLSVITQANLGGAGGFFTGVKAACERGHDWIWCMDDDTVPNPDALERFVENVAFRNPETGYLSSLVLWTDGSPHLMNIPLLVNHAKWLHRFQQDRCIPIRDTSFVSLMVKREAVMRAGLPLREFFIWGDDSEFTRRLSEHHCGYLVLDSVVVHKTKSNAPAAFTKVGPAERTKYLYGTRNRIILYRSGHSHPLIMAGEILHVLGHTIKAAITGRAPWAGVWWALKGIFYRRKIEFPSA